MLKGLDNYKYLLVAICKIIDFILVIPIKTRAAQDIADSEELSIAN